MGLFDLFKTKPKPRARALDAAQAKVLRQAAIRRCASHLNRLAHPDDRRGAIDELVKIGTDDAIATLLRRFTFAFPSSIVDQDEKDAALRGIVSLGEAALPAIRAFSERAESLAWPLRMMEAILDEEAFVGEVLELLSTKDTEYDRYIDPKVQLLAALEEHADARIREAVERFLEDVNDSTRYHAVGALLRQDDPGAARAAAALMKAFFREEVWRVQNRIVAGLVDRGWPIPESTRALFAEIATAFRIDENGVLHWRR